MNVFHVASAHYFKILLVELEELVAEFVTGSKLEHASYHPQIVC
jgi:hypothetical protein